MNGDVAAAIDYHLHSVTAAPFIGGRRPSQRTRAITHLRLTLAARWQAERNVDLFATVWIAHGEHGLVGVAAAITCFPQRAVMLILDLGRRAAFVGDGHLHG